MTPSGEASFETPKNKAGLKEPPAIARKKAKKSNDSKAEPGGGKMGAVDPNLGKNLRRNPNDDTPKQTQAAKDMEGYSAFVAAHHEASAQQEDEEYEATAVV